MMPAHCQQAFLSTIALILIANGCAAGGKPAPVDCPISDPSFGSRDDGSGRVEVLFKNDAGYPVDSFWVDGGRKEQQWEQILPGGTLKRNSFPGHGFRIRQVETGITLLEYRVGAGTSSEVRVSIQGCAAADAQELTGGDWELDPEEVAATRRLVHDQEASCLPANKSALWSCVRKMPPGTEHLPKERFGFQADDHIASHRECKITRSIGDTSDDDYSKLTNRLKIKRVSSGPGYLKMSLPNELTAVLSDWASHHADYWENAQSGRGWQSTEAIGGCYSNTHKFPFALLNLDSFADVKDQIIKHVQKVLEWWTNRPLVHTSTYGMRVYRRDAMLINHADRGDTHIASAVIQVFQECDEDGGWPLEVVGEDGIIREVYLQPGEMVLYEGARLLHGRPMRFKGKYFGNIFSHFKPQQPKAKDDL